MDKREEFDLDFDFEKEYGFDPSLMDNEFDDDADFDPALFADDLLGEEPVVAEAAPVEEAPEYPAYEEPVFDDTVFDDSVFEDTIFDDADPETLLPPVVEEAEEVIEDVQESAEPAPEKPRRNRKKKQAKPSFFASLFAPKAKAEKPEQPAPVQEPVVFDTEEEPVYAPVAEEPVYEAPAAEPVYEAPVEEPSAPAEEAAEVTPVQASMDPVEEATSAEQPKRRRRKKTKEQIFKEVYLPRIIVCVAAVLVLFMVIGSIVRAVSNGKQEDANASEQAAMQAALDAEAERLLAEAAVLAAGYDYEGAIAVLDTFSGDQSAYPEMLTARSEYSTQQSQLIEWKDPSSIPNLSFQVLIADPARAFTDRGNGKAYNRNFVTVDEFEKILQQLYDNGYVLVSLEDVVFTTTTDGKTTYAANTIYLPDGKKPIMITETMVNYYGYMIDSDDDGVPDAGGAGFASKLVVEDGEILAEMVTASGETVRGNYDLVPILNDFIEAHPDFSYRGARAIIAVTGDEGVFGYRTQTGDAAEIAAAQEVAQALRDDGYIIACYTYSNMNYSNASATEIQADLQKWTAQVVPVLGEVDVLVFAKSTDIADYNGGNQYNVLYGAGFRYFIGAANQPWAQVTNDYFHQKRIMVTGSQMAHGSGVFASYFNAMAVLNSTRGNVPT